jgi:hypothetical protein
MELFSDPGQTVYKVSFDSPQEGEEYESSI